MGFSKTFLTLLAFLATASAAEGAPAHSSRASCEATKTANVDLPSQIMKKKGMNENDPCPKSDSSGMTSSTCRDLVQKIEEGMKQWLAAHKRHCELIDKYGGDISCEAITCNAKQAEALADNSRTVAKERAEVRKMIQELKAMREEVANGMVEPTKTLASNVQGPVAGQKRLNATAGEIGQFAQQVLSRNLQQSDISRTKDEITREQLQVADMFQTIEKQLETRDRELATKDAQMKKARATNTTRATNGQSLNQGVTNNVAPQTSTTPNMGSMAGLAGPAAGLAAAAGGGGSAGGSSSSGMETNTYDTPSYDAYSASADGSTRNNNIGNQKSGSSAGILDASKEIAALRGENELPLPTNSSASSRSDRSGLKDALRARLAASGGGEGESASASTSAAAGGAAGSTNSSGEKKSGEKSSSPFDGMYTNEILAASGAGDSLGEDSFSLAGSETDAYVQSMVNNLMGEDDDRSIASEEELAGAEILAEDSASLFSRTRETHVRSVKKGLLVTNVRSRL